MQEIGTAKLKLQLQNVQQEMSSLRQQLRDLRSQRHSSCRLAITIATNSRQATQSPMNENTSVWSSAVDTATIELTKQSTLPPTSKKTNRHINKVVNKFVAKLLCDTDFSIPCESTGTKYTLDDISKVIDNLPDQCAPQCQHVMSGNCSSDEQCKEISCSSEELLNDCVRQLTFSDSQCTIPTMSSLPSPHSPLDITIRKSSCEAHHTESVAPTMSSLPSLHSPLDSTIREFLREEQYLLHCTKQLSFSDPDCDSTITTDVERQLGVTFTICSSPQDSAFDSSFSSSSSNPQSCASSQQESTDSGFDPVQQRPACVGAEFTHLSYCTRNGSSCEDTDISINSINSIDSDTTVFLEVPLSRRPITQKTKNSRGVLKQLCCVAERIQ